MTESPVCRLRHIWTWSAVLTAVADLLSGRCVSRGGASISLGFHPDREAILVVKGEICVKVQGMGVSRAHLLGQAKVLCHTIT